MKNKEGTVCWAILKFYEKTINFYRTKSRWFATDMFYFVRKELIRFGNKPFDSTISRKMRELRKEGLIDYEVIDQQKALYRWR